MHRAIRLVLSGAIAMSGLGALCGSAQALSIYSFTGMISSLDGTGNVLGVQGIVGLPISGSFSVDESQAFITGPTGAQASGLMGGPGILTVNVAGHVFSTNIDQMAVYQQSPAGVNVVSAFTIAFNLDLDGVPQNGYPRGNMAIQFAFPSATGLPNGPLTGISNPDFTDPQSYGVILENAGNDPENAIRFTFDSFTAPAVPAPASASLLIAGGLITSRRRR